MTEQEEIINTIKVLRKEVEVLTTRLQPAGTGHIITAIGVINGRIDELMLEAIAPMLEEDVYDGYEQHTEAMEQARLRKIQDAAAGRKPNKVRDAYLWSADKQGHWSPDDGVEFNGPFGMDEKKYTHTKEYYDTKRNKPMEGEDLPVKRKMTVSEQMQEELEPLPINTFT